MDPDGEGYHDSFYWDRIQWAEEGDCECGGVVYKNDMCYNCYTDAEADYHDAQRDMYDVFGN